MLRRKAVCTATCLAIIVLAPLARAAESCEPPSVGCAIYNGQQPLVAHLRDDDQALPAWTARCVNCHAGADKSGIFAPPLTSATLLGAQSRRGGPASRYEPKDFCRVLRSGIDPAGIMVRKAMPRYQLSDGDCLALWKYLTQR